MASAPAISIIMPVYNAQAHLKEAITSILQQSLGDFELILINDGSSDASQKIMSSFNDPRIQVINNPLRLKLSGALNKGLDAARGIYIARMDSDDIALPSRLETQLNFLNAHPEIDFCGSAISRIEQNRPAHPLQYPSSWATLQVFALFDTPLCHPSAMWRREKFKQANIRYDKTYYPSEDFEFWSHAISKGLQGSNLKETLLQYRIHPQSMTGSDWNAMDAQARRVVQNQLQNLGLTPTEKQLSRHRQIAMHHQASSPTELQAMHEWLQQLSVLLNANANFSSAAIHEVLGTFFWESCMNSLKLGRTVLQSYATSPFSSLLSKQTLILRLSFMKQNVLGSLNES